MSQIFEEYSYRRAEILGAELEPGERLDALEELIQQQSEAVASLTDEELEDALRAIKEQAEGLYIVRDGKRLEDIDPKDYPTLLSLRNDIAVIELEKLHRRRPAA